MSEKLIFNGGQRRVYKEGEAAPVYERAPYDKTEFVPNIPALEVHEAFKDKNYVVTVDITEKIVGIHADMIDWWWGNMEKGYHIWAPGEHYGFDWIVPPCEVGYEGSVEAAYEFEPTNPVVITRVGMQEYPFTDCFERCWMGKGKLGPITTLLVHMYEDTPEKDGILWRTTQVMSADDAAFIAEHREMMPDTSDHLAYESGRFRYFLPQLYDLWKNHPDPWQNIRFDLRTEKKADGTWKHISTNDSWVIK